MNRIFFEVNAYYSPYPTLSDEILSDLVEIGSLTKKQFFSKHSGTHGLYRINRALSTLVELKLAYLYESKYTLAISRCQAASLTAFNFTQTQLRLLTYIKTHGSVYFRQFSVETKADRSQFLGAIRRLIDIDLVEMHEESASRGGIQKRVYTLKTKVAQTERSASITD